MVVYSLQLNDPHIYTVFKKFSHSQHKVLDQFFDILQTVLRFRHQPLTHFSSSKIFLEHPSPQTSTVKVRRKSFYFFVFGLVWYFPGWGWVVLIKTKANLAQFQMKLPAGAKIGKNDILAETTSNSTTELSLVCLHFCGVQSKVK